MRKRRTGRLFAAAATAATLAAATYGFTAANTVPDSKAGDGTGAISGYTVSNVDYVLNASDPGNIDQVTFDLDSAPAAGSDVEVKLVSTGTDWYSCTAAGTAVSCDTTAPQATVVSADELRVVVAD